MKGFWLWFVIIAAFLLLMIMEDITVYNMGLTVMVLLLAVLKLYDDFGDIGKGKEKGRGGRQENVMVKKSLLLKLKE